jgi:3-methylcrotonyl-CoA carboxylase alpha subunit
LEEIRAAQGEATRSFGDSRLLIERYVESARHIEVQIFGDQHGNLAHIFERECSVQRRHQKIIEVCSTAMLFYLKIRTKVINSNASLLIQESPSPLLTPEMRSRMTKSALEIGNLISYVGAGTVEFIVDGSQATSSNKPPDYFFLEVNTRLQVEHPVTEEITGLDLVELQIWVARGGLLTDRLPRNLEISVSIF